MKSFTRILVGALSVWALGCSGTTGEAFTDAAVDSQTGDAPPVVDTPPAVDSPSRDDLPVAVDVPPMADVPPPDVTCGVVVQLEGFGAFRPEDCSSADAARPIADAGSSSDVGSGAPRPPDAGPDGSGEFLPPRPDSGMVEDLPAAEDAGPRLDTGVTDPISCRLDCAAACRDVVVSNGGRYSRFWTTGTCSRVDASRVRCVTDVVCPRD